MASGGEWWCSSSNMLAATRNAMAMAQRARKCAIGNRSDLLERHGRTTKGNVERALNKSQIRKIKWIDHQIRKIKSTRL